MLKYHSVYIGSDRSERSNFVIYGRDTSFHIVVMDCKTPIAKTECKYLYYDPILGM